MHSNDKGIKKQKNTEMNSAKQQVCEVTKTHSRFLGYFD